MRIAIFLQQVALCTFAATTVSCILSDKCIWVNAVGTVWEATVYGTARDQDMQQTSVTGRYEACYEAEQDERLTAENVNDPPYVALRQLMLSGASLDCTQVAMGKKYTNIECNPLAGDPPAVAVLKPKGSCPVAAKKLIKGTLSDCISPDDTICVIDPEATPGGETIPTTSD